MSNKKKSTRNKVNKDNPNIFDDGGGFSFNFDKSLTAGYNGGLKMNNGGTSYNFGNAGQNTSGGQQSSNGAGVAAGIMGAVSSLGPQLISSMSQYNTKASDNAKLLGSSYARDREQFNKGTGILGALGLNLFNDASQQLNNIEDKAAGILGSMKAPEEATTLDEAMNNLSSYRKQEYSFDNPYDSGFSNFMTSAGQGAIAGTGIVPGWGTLIGTGVGALTSLINGKRNREMYNEAASAARKAIRDKENFIQSTMMNNVKNINAKNTRSQMAQVAAYGGPLGVSLTPVNGAIGYMQNEELISALDENMTQNNNRRTTLPTFAFGGALGGYGGSWSNGLNFIKAGGTHGQNPIGGVPMGIAQDGKPNLVEEGEVIWNDYVFSNRIKVPNVVLERFGIKGKDITFAEAVNKAQKSFAERPYDPIEKRGLESTLAGLMQEQETIRQKKEERKAAKVNSNNMFRWGGHYENGVWIPDKQDELPSLSFEGMFANDRAMAASDGAPYNIDPVLETPRAEAIHSLGVPTDNTRKAQDYWLTNKLDLLPEYVRVGIGDAGYNYTGNYNGSKDETRTSTKPSWETWLRYAPVLGSAAGLGHTLFNRPDYEYAKELESAAEQYANRTGHVTPTMLGDYLAYNPFDRLFYANELGAQQAATRRGIMNLSNGNRGAALAGLLAAGYNGNIGLGKLYREGDEYNLAQRQKVAEFNRGTNQYNSQADLSAQEMNARLDATKSAQLLDAKMRALGMKQAEDQYWNQSLAANLTGLFDDIGNIGWEAVNRNMINDNEALLYGFDRNGTTPYKGSGKKNGGYLTIKNRRAI